jgi:hypothetical protein
LSNGAIGRDGDSILISVGSIHGCTWINIDSAVHSGGYTPRDLVRRVVLLPDISHWFLDHSE